LGYHGDLLRELELRVSALPDFGIVKQEIADRDLVAADNGGTLVCAAARVFTVQAGMPDGFGVAFKGLVSFINGNGVLVTDVRTPGSPSPWCVLVQTDVDRYDVVGAVP
jgi:hypothetical protein